MASKKITGIFKRTGSDIYTTSVRRLDRAAGTFKWIYVSTHTSDPAKAMVTRAELQKLEDLAGGGGDTSMTRLKALAAVNSILAAHGIPLVDDPLKTISISDYLPVFLRDIGETSESNSRKITMRIERVTSAMPRTQQLRLVTRSQLQTIFDSFSPELAVNTIGLVKSTLVRFFESAKADGFTSENPAKKIKIPKGKGEKKEPFTTAEIGRIMDACKDFPNGDEWRIASLFGLCLGVRLADSCTRQWGEVDLDSAVIRYIPGKTSRHGTIVTAPIVNPLLSHLLRRHDQGGTKEPFITPVLAETHNVTRCLQFMRLLKSAGVHIPKVERATGGRAWNKKGFHSWRHTLPTLLASAGVPVEMRMAIVGHTTESIHMGYTHKDEAAMRIGLEKAMDSLEY